MLCCLKTGWKRWRAPAVYITCNFMPYVSFHAAKWKPPLQILRMQKCRGREVVEQTFLVPSQLFCIIFLIVDPPVAYPSASPPGRGKKFSICCITC